MVTSRVKKATSRRPSNRYPMLSRDALPTAAATASRDLTTGAGTKVGGFGDQVRFGQDDDLRILDPQVLW
ncbi:hypothetical protein [Lentzea aerocolonigenes]|uniref:hypothetical protein n=1 Tax=Lentzea aerocolonigenes TaxID=68170 RepID=UPI0012E10770|nr:hypothetical protein [Lentzea aerocolonigenes]